MSCFEADQARSLIERCFRDRINNSTADEARTILTIRHRARLFEQEQELCRDPASNGLILRDLSQTAAAQQNPHKQSGFDVCFVEHRPAMLAQPGVTH